MKYENAKGESVNLSHDVGGRFRLTVYTRTPWGSGPFTNGSDFGSFRRLKADYDRIVAGLEHTEVA